MNLKDVMNYQNFVIVGDTLNPDKYAYKIKEAMIQAKYQVSCVGKELSSINDITYDIDILDLCIHPAKGIKLLQENMKPIKGVVIQPGASSIEILDLLQTNNIPYIEDCLLIGLNKYKKG